MEFRISYSSKSGYAIEHPHDVIGTDGVDKIREDLEVELPLDRIKGYTRGLRTDVSLSVTERIARESGLFRSTDKITVKVLPEQLNEFTHLETHCDRNGDTGEVTEAWLAWAIDEESIVDAWVDAGFPTDWRELYEVEDTESTTEKKAAA